jgi:hypothetical protein
MQSTPGRAFGEIAKQIRTFRITQELEIEDEEENDG